MDKSDCFTQKMTSNESWHYQVLGFTRIFPNFTAHNHMKQYKLSSAAAKKSERFKSLILSRYFFEKSKTKNND